MYLPISKIFKGKLNTYQTTLDKNDVNITSIEKALDSETVRLTDLQTRINACYAVIFSLTGKLSSDQKMITSIESTLTALQTIITVLSVLPVPTTPFVTIGIILTLSQKLTKVSDIINGLKSIISQITPIISSLTVEVVAQKQRLDDLSQRLASILESNNVDTSALGLLNEANRIIDFSIGGYQEYTFYLKEEKVGKLLRHYAVANKDGREYYVTNKSFTLNPNILKEQLISQIKAN